MSQDPAFVNTPEKFLEDPQQMNSYSYARNNPIRFLDPTGESAAERVGGIFVGALTTVVGAALYPVQAFFHPIQTYNELKQTGNTLRENISAFGDDPGAFLGAGVQSYNNLSDTEQGELIGSLLVTAATPKLASEFKVGGGKAGVSGGDISSVAQSISKGHAFNKHVIRQAEFPGIKTPQEFQSLIEGIIKNQETIVGVGKVNNTKTGYWNEKTQTIVIHDPKNPDLGTAFKPPKGKAYFDQYFK